MRGESFSRFDKKNGLPNNHIADILSDSDGNIWVSTYGGGVAMFKEDKFFPYWAKDGISSKMTTVLLEDREKSLWIGTNGSGLNRFRKGKFVTFSRMDGLKSDVVSSVSELRDGSILAGTWRGGAATISGNTVTPFAIRNFENRTILSSKQTADGTIYLGTLRSGLFRIENGAAINIEGTESFPGPHITSFVEDPNGDLWIGGTTGLIRLVGGNIEEVLRGPNVISLKRGSDGTLWASTDGNGLYGIRNGTKIRIDMARGFPPTAYGMFRRITTVLYG